MSPWAVALQVVVVVWVARMVSVAVRVVLAQAVYRLVRVELPAALVEVSGMWKRHNLGRMPGRV